MTMVGGRLPWTLKAKGKAEVRAVVTYKPTGGEARTVVKPEKLVPRG